MNKNLRIKELLNIKDLSLSDLATEINELNHVRRGEKGYLTSGNLYVSLNDNPSLNTLKKVAIALNVELGELFKRKNETYGFITIHSADKQKSSTFFELDKLMIYLSRILQPTNKYDFQSPISIKERFYEIVSKKGLNIKMILEVADLTKQNLDNSLILNPSLEKLERLANILDVDIKAFFEQNSEVVYKGLVTINGETFTINSIIDIQNLYDYIDNFEKKKISDEELNTIIDEVLVDIYETDHISRSYIENGNKFNMDYLDLNSNSDLDSTRENCWSFRNNGDTRNGKPIFFGNMVKYPLRLFDKDFNDSESVYVAGCYTNSDERSIEIMNEISNFKGGGYILKKTYRNADKTIEPSKHIRADWEIFNVNWMLLVVWSKVKTNEEFRKMLEQVPIDTHIIEDTSFMPNGGTTQIWGAKNSDLKSLRKEKNKQLIKRLQKEGVSVIATYDKGEQILHNRINNIGTWVGKNLTGKCLKLCQLALLEKTIPPIDFDLLNNSNIYWFGKKITIYVDENMMVQKIDVD